MKIVPFKETIRLKLIEAANNYASLLNRQIVIASPIFIVQKQYVVRFYDTNYLHLTGVKTELSPRLFFQKCLEGRLSLEDFECDTTSQQKGLVRLKMRNLVNINSFFDEEIDVQEDFEKGSIKCFFGASDNKCTIGFVDAKYCARPRTILDKNHLDKTKPIVRVKPIIVIKIT